MARRVQALCHQEKSMEQIDQKLISLVDDQQSLGGGLSELQAIKDNLTRRTGEELEKIEQKKQG